MGPSYAFTYNNTLDQTRRFRTYWRAEVETSGNVLQGIYLLSRKAMQAALGSARYYNYRSFRQQDDILRGNAVTRRHISTGSLFEEQIGYSRAVVVDGWVFVAGTTGYDYENMRMPATIEEQCRNTIATIAGALAQAGCSLDDVVRGRYIVPDPAEWPRC